MQNTENGSTITRETSDNFLELSLGAGKWRYRVSATDLLGKHSATGEWISFTVQDSPLPKKGEEEFTQTLSWTMDENALSYRVELQNLDAATTTLFETDAVGAKLSLPSGKYRYRVAAYDALGRLGKNGAWTNFEVYKANKPEIKHIEEKLQPDADGKIALGVEIANIAKGSKVEIVRETEEGHFDDDDTHGATGDETGSADTVYFDKVGAGKWRLRVTNPSGLTTESDVLEVTAPPAVVVAEAVPKPADADDAHYRNFAFSAGGSLLFSPYDGTLFNLNNVTYFGQELIPALNELYTWGQKVLRGT